MTKPAGWKNYDDFAHGISTNRLPPVDLAGQSFGIGFEDGSRLQLDFRAGNRVAWRSGPDEAEDWYEAIPAAAGVLFIDMTFAGRPREALTLVIDRGSRRALSIRCIVREGDVGGEPRVAQLFLAGIVGEAGATGMPPAESRDLVGLRALYTYSPNHVYEHTYLSAGRYAWQCLVGVQRGHGDVDLTTTYKFADDLYVFTFREFKIPVASVFLFDFAAMRSTGKFLGLTGEGVIANNPAGSFIQKLSMTFYPDGIAPV